MQAAIQVAVVVGVGVGVVVVVGVAVGVVVAVVVAVGVAVVVGVAVGVGVVVGVAVVVVVAVGVGVGRRTMMTREELESLKGHTAGPWKHDACSIYSEDQCDNEGMAWEEPILEAGMGRDRDYEANMALVAAAPKLLETCLELMDEVERLRFEANLSLLGTGANSFDAQ